VAAQIQRYRQAADRDVAIDLDEVVSVLRLVGRRPDAPLVFADAGRRAARYAARARARPARTLARVSPAGVGRRIALRAVARLSRDVFGGDLRAKSQGSEVSMSEPISILALPDGAACAFFGSAYGELLRNLTAFEGAMLHEQCRSRGGEVCVWRSAPAEVYE
jgi:bacteriochlorophyll 4-vinyl reductase